MALGADHVQSAGLLGAGAELDIGASAGHVCCDGYIPDRLPVRVLMLLPGLGDNVCLALVLLGVKHFMLDAELSRQLGRKRFAALDAGGPDQHRPARFGDLLDFRNDRVPLFRLLAVDAIFIVLANDRAVGWDRDDFQLVDFAEFLGFGLGGAGHARQGLVQLEEILQRDGCQGLRLLLDGDALLGFDRLVQAVAPLAADHFAAGKLVDDDDFQFAPRAALDDVIFVLLVDHMGAHRLFHQMRPLHVVADVEAADAGKILRLGDAFVRQMHALAVPFNLVILGDPFLAFLGLGQLL